MKPSGNIVTLGLIGSSIFGCSQGNPATSTSPSTTGTVQAGSVPPQPLIPSAQGPATPPPSTSAPTGVPGEPDQFAAGRQVFASKGCARCHAIAGQVFATTAGGPGGPAPGAAPAAGGFPGAGTVPQGAGPGGAMPAGQMRGPMGGGMGMGKGPELTTVGAKRTRDWIIEHTRNPKAHNPQSRMPAFDGKISDGDLQALADFLASLK